MLPEILEPELEPELKSVNGGAQSWEMDGRHCRAASTDRWLDAVVPSVARMGRGTVSVCGQPTGAQVLRPAMRQRPILFRPRGPQTKLNQKILLAYGASDFKEDGISLASHKAGLICFFGWRLQLCAEGYASDGCSALRNAEWNRFAFAQSVHLLQF